MGSNYRKALFIEGNRDCYGPDQREDCTVTVEELIAILEQFDGDARVFLRNDNGYTYGSLGWDDFAEGVYDDDAVLVDDGSDEYWQARGEVY